MSTTFNGTLFTGETLATVPLTLEVGDGRLRSQTGEIALDVAVADVRTSDRLASLPRFLYLPDGRTIATPDNDAIDALLAGQRRGQVVAAVHWLEARARVAAVATLLLVATVAATVWWGLPVLARKAAMSVPTSIEKQAGQTALLTINRLLAPTQLRSADRSRVEAQISRLVKAGGLTANPEIVFRSMGGKYPNAFALPGGFIVVSDELVALANDDELAAVLAHEIGHWQLRHGLQSVLRGSVALLVVSTVTGDLSTLTTFAGTIPFVLLQRGYSREFEEQADAYGLDLLRQAGIDVAHFATILKKLEEARPAVGQDFTYLSTHPATADRIRRINPDGHQPVAATPTPAASPTTPGPSFPKIGVTSHAMAQTVATINSFGPSDIPPRAVRQPAPIYSEIMIKNHLQGDVTIEFVIDEHGDVQAPEVIRSTYKEFEAPALVAVAQWKFTPGLLHGQTVPTRASQKLEFKLDDPPKAGALAPGK